MRWAICCVLCGLALGAIRAEDGESDLVARFAQFSSPDGRFALRTVEKDGVVSEIVVVEKKSGRAVATLTEDVSQPETLSLIWAPYAKSFAANFRAGGRSDTMRIFRWDGQKFAALTSPEGELSKKFIDPATARELKAAGLPETTQLRRVWDSWTVERWTDAATVEIRGESTSSYPLNDDTADLTIAVQAMVRFDEDGKAKLVKVEEVPARD